MKSRNGGGGVEVQRAPAEEMVGDLYTDMYGCRFGEPQEARRRVSIAQSASNASYQDLRAASLREEKGTQTHTFGPDIFG